jgi:hypothetical protein
LNGKIRLRKKQADFFYPVNKQIFAILVFYLQYNGHAQTKMFLVFSSMNYPAEIFYSKAINKDDFYFLNDVI